MNPITTLYYVAPACFACLLIPFMVVDYPKMWPAGVPMVSLSSAFLLPRRERRRKGGRRGSARERGAEEALG